MFPLISKYPEYIVYFVTSRCNLSCAFCLNKKNQDNADSRKELSLDELDKFLTNTGKIRVLSITGGEPFLREDIADIVKLFKKKSGIK